MSFGLWFCFFEPSIKIRIVIGPLLEQAENKPTISERVWTILYFYKDFLW